MRKKRNFSSTRIVLIKIDIACYLSFFLLYCGCAAKTLEKKDNAKNCLCCSKEFFYVQAACHSRSGQFARFTFLGLVFLVL